MLRKIFASLPTWQCGEGQWSDESDRWTLIDAISDALCDHYGPWADRWHWGRSASQGAVWFIERMPAPAEMPAFVADELVTWRRWLEHLAELFDRLRPPHDPEQTVASSDTVTAWEYAIASLMRATDARTVDGDDWQGWCSLTLRWFLTTFDMPAQQAQELVDGLIDERFRGWHDLTAADINSVSEQLARDVLEARGAKVISQSDNWPDTWPRDWPSWRATNLGRLSG